MKKLTIKAYENKATIDRESLSLIKGGSFLKTEGGRVGYAPVGTKPVSEPEETY